MAVTNLITERASQGTTILKRVLLGVTGLGFGAVFLWLALRNIDARELRAVAARVHYPWLVAAVCLYLIGMVLRTLRWGTLLRATASVKWRHAGEAMMTGFAANYLLPGRIGELFRAEYARRLFQLSRFTALGTIVVERVCDGVVLVLALWVGLALVLSPAASASASWILLVGVVSTAVFGSALMAIIFLHHIDISRFGVPAFLTTRWDSLVDGISTVVRGHTGMIVLTSVAIWLAEVLALESMISAFVNPLSFAQGMVLVALASLSTLVPTAPGYLGTYQFVFASVFALFGYAESAGIVVATAMQLFCFGSVTILGILVLLSRGGIAVLRGFR